MHADIKGSNLLVGSVEDGYDEVMVLRCVCVLLWDKWNDLLLFKVYLVDYGLASSYDMADGQHKVYKEDRKRQHEGTVAFTSIDAHKGVCE